MTFIDFIVAISARHQQAGFAVGIKLLLQQRRFGGLERLYGMRGAGQIRSSHVVVIGIGGVGSWAAEALARSGVGQLTLIDLDHVAESTNGRARGER